MRITRLRVSPVLTLVAFCLAGWLGWGAFVSADPISSIRKGFGLVGGSKSQRTGTSKMNSRTAQERERIARERGLIVGPGGAPQRDLSSLSDESSVRRGQPASRENVRRTATAQKSNAAAAARSPRRNELAENSRLGQSARANSSMRSSNGPASPAAGRSLTGGGAGRNVLSSRKPTGSRGSESSRGLAILKPKTTPEDPFLADDLASAESPAVETARALSARKGTSGKASVRSGRGSQSRGNGLQRVNAQLQKPGLETVPGPEQDEDEVAAAHGALDRRVITDDADLEDLPEIPDGTVAEESQRIAIEDAMADDAMLEESLRSVEVGRSRVGARQKTAPVANGAPAKNNKSIPATTAAKPAANTSTGTAGQGRAASVERPSAGTTANRASTGVSIGRSRIGGGVAAQSTGAQSTGAASGNQPRIVSKPGTTAKTAANTADARVNRSRANDLMHRAHLSIKKGDTATAIRLARMAEQIEQSARSEFKLGDPLPSELVSQLEKLEEKKSASRVTANQPRSVGSVDETNAVEASSGSNAAAVSEETDIRSAMPVRDPEVITLPEPAETSATTSANEVRSLDVTNISSEVTSDDFGRMSVTNSDEATSSTLNHSVAGEMSDSGATSEQAIQTSALSTMGTNATPGTDATPGADSSESMLAMSETGSHATISRSMEVGIGSETTSDIENSPGPNLLPAPGTESADGSSPPVMLAPRSGNDEMAPPPAPGQPESVSNRPHAEAAPDQLETDDETTPVIIDAGDDSGNTTNQLTSMSIIGLIIGGLGLFGLQMQRTNEARGRGTRRRGIAPSALKVTPEQNSGEAK